MKETIKLEFIYAAGSGDFNYHRNNRGSGTINNFSLKDGSKIVVKSMSEKLFLINLHSIIMIFTWCILVPITLIIIHNIRPNNSWFILMK